MKKIPAQGKRREPRKLVPRGGKLTTLEQI